MTSRPFSSNRTDEGIRERLLRNAERIQEEAVAARSGAAFVPEFQRPQTTTEDIGQRVREAAERVAEQPLIKTRDPTPEAPDLFTAGPGDIQQFLQEESGLEVTLGDVGAGIAGFIGQLAEDVKDMGLFGLEVVRQSGTLAKTLAVGDIETQVEGLTEFVENVPEEQEESITRGMALTGAFLMSVPTGLLGREGFTRLAGAALKSGARGQLGFLGQSVAESQAAQAAARLSIRVGTGVAEGSSFGLTYGSMRPLHDGEASRSDAILHDALAFGLLDGGFRLLGAGVGALNRRIARDVDAQAAIRDIFRATRESLIQERVQPFNVPFAHPMPPEPLSAAETAAQYAAGGSTQAPLRFGPLAQAREAARGFVRSITERFPNAGRIDGQIQLAALQKLDSEVTGKYFGRRAMQLLTAGMTEEQTRTFGRALVESRLRQVRRDHLDLAAKLDRAESAMASGQRAGIEDLQSRFSKQGIAFNDEGRAVVELNLSSFTADEIRQMTARIRTEILNDEERQLLQLPQFQQAFDDLQNVVNPLLTEVAQRNGLRTLVDPELPYARLWKARRRDLEADVPAVRARVDLDDDLAREQILEGRVFEVGAGRGGTRETGAARAAFGQAPMYITEPEEIIARSFQEAFARDYQNEAVARIVNAPWALPVREVETSAGNLRRTLEDGSPLPKEISFGGETFPTRVITLSGNPQVLARRRPIHVLGEIEGGQRNIALQDIELRVRESEGLPAVGASEVVEPELGKYVVPKPIADVWREAFVQFGRRPNPLERLFPSQAARQAMEGFMDFNVRLLLSSPVEAFAHSNRVLSQLASIPGVGDRDALGRIANKFGAWFGPRLTGLREMFNVYRSEEARRMEAFLATKVPGAIPTRAFPFEFASESVGDFARRGGEGGVLRTAEEALELGRRFLFDLPEINSRSVFQFGFDTRARVVGALGLQKITRRELGRDPTIREYQKFLEQFGQYTDDIQSNLVQGLRKSRIAPFAGTQAGFIPAEIRKLFGNPNLPKSIRDELTVMSQARLRAETLWRGVVGTATMIAFTQKALTDDWPWENEQGHQTDLKVGFISDRGERRPVYLPTSRILDPVSGRGMRIVGGRAIVENLGDEEDIIPDALRDVVNTGITFATGAPGLNALFTVSTGSAPFWTDEGEVLRLVPPQPTASLEMKHRLFEAAGTANPTIESLFGLGRTGDLPTGIRLLGTVTPGLEVGQPVDLGESGAIREERAELFEISRDRVVQALREHPQSFAERRQFYREESEKFPSVAERRRAFRAMLRTDVQIRRSRQMNLERARRDRPFP